MNKDLFGNEIKETEQFRKPTGKYEIYRSRFNYREGTKEKRCKTCDNLVKSIGYNRDWYKCKLQGISNCTSSDIRLKMICDNWRND